MSALHRFCPALFALGLILGCSSPARAQWTVFDPETYSANLLIDAHALQQIANQVRQLQNEAQMLQRLEQNLQRLGVTVAPDLQRGLADLVARLREGEGMPLRLNGTQSAYDQLFPKNVSAALSGDQVQQNAAARLQEAYAAARRTALLQAAIADGIDGDRQLLADVMARSRGAAGALAAAQAGNELAGLSVKQALALQALLAAQARSQTLARASAITGEEEARQRFQAFLGPASAYSGRR
jgi:P-type conjugative transfer protein TrbJ